eukprot:TRINITY_DN5254_c4_g1_i1.p1 TRINITY_DN5254_c4_g1~~TRINITY_DN5254_c4_g1_i1.p1  ORF type:complete len:226 (+),score=73.34 TRINITY_DN5254_c4_g1_i1:68-679(+)
MQVPTRKSWAEVADSASFHPLLPEISRLLERAAVAGDAHLPAAVSAFDSVDAAPVSIADYLIRMCKYGLCSSPVFVHMLVLIDRVARKVRLTTLNVHRIIAVAFFVSVKLVDDEFYGCSYYASISGVAADDLHDMERIFIREVDWELHVEAEQYTKVCQNLRGPTSPPPAARVPATLTAKPAFVGTVPVQPRQPVGGNSRRRG